MKNITIGKKLYFAFSAVLLLMLVMGGLSIFQLTDITNTFDELISSYQEVGDDAKEVHISLLTAHRHEKDFTARRDKKYIERMDKTLSGMTTLLKEMAGDSDRMDLGTVAAEIQAALKAVSSYKTAFGKVTELILAQGDKESGIRGNMRKLAHDMETVIKEIESSELMEQYLLLISNEKDYVLKEDDKYVKKAKGVVDKISTTLTWTLTDQGSKDNIQNISKAYLSSFNNFATNIATMKKEYPIMREGANIVEGSVLKINKEIDEIVASRVKDAQKKKESTIWLLYISCGVIVLVSIFLSFFSVRSITKPLNRVIEGLNEGSDQVASASGQVSSSSQQLAEGSSEQAASIEETSSSLEEMSSMTKQNADNANQADNLMKEANQVVGRANNSMIELIQSMEDISKASEETSKIIKTIDEIAFQTNLLALNAAVEAARAGEAGAGFAVVADEVRNLAMRAADAAKNTADLIEGTVKKVKDGGDLVATTNEAFTEVATSSTKVGDLVAEIAAASNEQAQGIEQVNKVVVEMDKVVQQNAANAEESASASEEMSAQAEQMKGFVGDLVSLVGGSANGSKKASYREVKAKTSRGLPAQAIEADNKEVAVHKAKKVSPDQVIPMDEVDFKDF